MREGDGLTTMRHDGHSRKGTRMKNLKQKKEDENIYGRGENRLLLAFIGVLTVYLFTFLVCAFGKQVYDGQQKM